MKRMTARYPGKCRGCGKAIKPGDAIAWEGKRQTFHDACYATAQDDNNTRDYANAMAEAEASRGRGYSLADTDYAMGAARAQHLKEYAGIYGEEAAAAEELAWELKDPSY